MREEFTLGGVCYVVQFTKKHTLLFYADACKSSIALYRQSDFERRFGDDPPDTMWTATHTGNVFGVKRRISAFLDKALRRYAPYYFTFSALEEVRRPIYKKFAERICGRYGYSYNERVNSPVYSER
jgi:hypothetical protein